MSSMRVVTNLVACCAALSASLSGAGPASAQYLAPNAPPQYGVLQITPGFRPDPMVADGIGGGRVALGNVNSSCRGYSQEAPSHVIVARAPISFLAIMVNAGFDSTLFVQTPDGRIFCNDDTDGLQPRVEISSPPGPILVWVGAYSSSGGGPYRMGISGGPNVRGAQLGMPGMVAHPSYPPQPVYPPQPPPSALQPQAPPLYGNVSLRMGFQPDPVMLAGQAGGPISASQVNSSCRGWVNPQPNHVVMAQTAFQNLRFVVRADHDTTLMVQYPDGRLLCNDDGGGSLNPLIEGPSPPGPVLIWVGSYSSGRSGPYAMGVTEIPGINYQNLGGPAVGPTLPTVPPVQPPVQPPPRMDVTRVDLQPRIPVTLFGPGMTSATLALWSPRGGPRVELGVNPTSGGLAVSASVNGTEIPLATVPNEIAREAVVTITQQPNDRLLVRAERPPGSGGDPGAQLLLLVRWDGGAGAPSIAEQWLGTFQDRAPRWAR